MNRLRLVPAVLCCLAVTALGGCGGEETGSPAGSAPSASSVSPSTAAPASPVPSPPAATSPAPSSSTAPGASGATGAPGDKALCESVKKAGDEMKAELVAAIGTSGQDPSPAVFKKILTELGRQVTALALTGGDSRVASAAKRFGAEAAKAAAAADPVTAADNLAFEKAGANLTAACKPAGVKLNF